MPNVNPEILTWARNQAGYSIDEAAQRLGLRDRQDRTAIETLMLIEAGELPLSRPLLLKMAKHYRRPLVAFYAATPPHNKTITTDFRTLPEVVSAIDNANVKALVRRIVARQSMLRSLLEESEESEVLEFVGKYSVRDGVDGLVKAINSEFKINSADYRSASNPMDAFKYLRARVEDLGIFVLLAGNLGSHHSNIDTKLFRGFALADSVAPMIVINDQDAKAAWSFTLLHELVHILIGQTGISNSSVERRIEKFCNDVASQLLFPLEEAQQLFDADYLSNIPFDKVTEIISRVASQRNLSLSMVAYTFFRGDMIGEERWETASQTFREWWLAAKRRQRENRQGSGGPSYRTVRNFQLGSNLVGFIARMHESGSLSTSKAGKILDVSPWNVRPIIDGAFRSGGVN